MMNPRLYAVEVLLQLLPGAHSPRSLTTLLAKPLSDKLSQAFACELIYGVTRWYQCLTTIIQIHLHKPLRKKDRDIHIILLLGAYQVFFSKQPDYAVVSETSNLSRLRYKPWAVGLVNALLRKLYQQQNQKNAHIAHIAHTQVEYLNPKLAFPNWIKNNIERSYPKQATDFYQTNLTKAPLTLRINHKHISTQAFLVNLLDNGLQARCGELTNTSVTLSESTTPVHTIPGFNQGQFTVQDEGAQLCAQLLQPQPGERVLDACCAPGGKTTHLLEQCAELAELVAVDSSAKRLTQTQENLDRLDLCATLKQAAVEQLDDWWDKTPFDKILVDAPCSGTGVLRRHPDIMWLKKAQDVPALAQKQAKILRSMWQILKPRGKLLYCTCSVLPQENVELIQAFVAEKTDAHVLTVNIPWGITQTVGHQLLPKIGAYDGFYYALIQKN